LALPRFPTRMLYLKSLGFNEDPFLPIPDPRFLYLSSQHAPLLERLFSIAERGSGLAVVDGEKGVGKSTAARRLQSYFQCQPEAYQVAFLSNASLESAYAALAAISAQFFLSRRKGIESQWSELVQFTKDQNREGRSAIVLIDEPASLSKEAIQQLQAIAASLAPVIIFGQPELAVTSSKIADLHLRSHDLHVGSNLWQPGRRDQHLRPGDQRHASPPAGASRHRPGDPHR
jgi:type II secretory pathway predicted ATPase ExeA